LPVPQEYKREERRTVINTTTSVYRRDEPKGTAERVLDHGDGPPQVNTTAIYDPAPEGTLQVIDEEPQVEFIISGANWIAEYSDGTTADVALFAILEDGSCYGVGVNQAGKLDLSASLETKMFAKYSKERNSQCLKH
jgi:hypothetical protein